MIRYWGLVWLVFFASPLSAQATFWLRNTDPQALFQYWTVDFGVKSAAEVLPLLPLTPTGIHPVAPGERVKVSLAPGQNLVGVFVPWSDPLSFRSKLAGGFLLATEVPSKGTLLVDRAAFVAANRGRTLEGSLQQWGLTIPQFVLDGRVEDWRNVRMNLEWGPPFLPGNQNWPSLWPRLRSLQVVDRGGLWVRLGLDRPWSAFPSAVSLSLVLRREGAFWEWPLTGQDPTVWLWKEGAAPAAVGWSIRRDADLEAWIPWDRVSAAEKQLWLSSVATWSLLVTDKDQTRTLDLSSFSLGGLP